MNLINIWEETEKWARLMPIPKTYHYKGLLDKEPCPPKDRPTEEIKIDIKDCDCLKMAQFYVKQGHKVALLNMASNICPGGGVKNGAKAQEEHLFRCTNLCTGLIRGFYRPFPGGRKNRGLFEDSILVSKDVIVGRLGEKYEWLDELFKVDMISCAALRHPAKKDERFTKEYDRRLALMKIMQIFQTARYLDCNVLILGAWGCGAFNGPVIEIAEMFKKVMEDPINKKYFSIIGFPILGNLRLLHHFENVLTKNVQQH